MKQILLSICIPNYNRPALLAENLEAIVTQDLNGVELIISDDHSPEDIDTVIEKFKKKHPRIALKYYKNKKNLGFDKHILKIAQYAKGKYVWEVSNDDKLLPGAINRIKKVLQHNPQLSLVHVNYERFDYILKKITSSRMVDLSQDKYFTDQDEFFFAPLKNSYFKYLGVNTLTLSTNIFNRRLWLSCYPSIRKFIGHNFIHEFVIAKMLSKKPSVYFLAKPLVRYLANNHRIWPNDIWKDYNNLMLGFLQEIGYDSTKVEEARNRQREYEIREGLTRTKPLVTVYQSINKLRSLVKDVLSSPPWKGKNI